MELTGKLVGVSTDMLTSKTIVSLEVKESKNAKLLIDNNKEDKLRIEIKKYREKRSKDANAYCWVLIQKIADILNVTKWEVYLQMIKEFSNVCTYIILQNTKALETLKESYRLVEEVGEVNVNGKTGIQCRLYYGSSTFDTKEMSLFLSGIIETAKELGIETLQPHILEQMKKEWCNYGKDKQ